MSPSASYRRSPLSSAKPACITLVPVLALVFGAGCSQSPRIEPLPPQTVTSGPAPTPPSDDGFAVAAEPARETPPAGEPLTIYIEGRPTEPPSGSGTSVDPDAVATSELLRASAAERRRRESAPEAVLVITDENLSELAEGGRVTIGAAPAAQDSDASSRLGVSEEEIYWRSGVRKLRQSWRDAIDAIAELEEQAAELRTRFYAEDDPVHRDRVIKPEWDRALDRLDGARRAATRSQEELNEFLDRGFREGALPGWLREGEELEPEPPPRDDGQPTTVDPGEPRVLDPPRR